MENITQVIEQHKTNPDLTIAQVNSFLEYTREHPRMEVRSVWFDIYSKILFSCFASGLVLGILQDGSKHS